MYCLFFFLTDEEEHNDKTLMYYVNDGVYGSFNCILYDHAHVKPVLQKVIGKYSPFLLKVIVFVHLPTHARFPIIGMGVSQRAVTILHCN